MYAAPKPMQALLGVLDQVFHAAVQGDRSHEQIQVIEELSVFLGQVISHLPVVIAVEDAVGDADVIGRHLVNALGDADDGRWGQAAGAGEAALRPHGAGGRRVGRHGGWASSALATGPPWGWGLGSFR